MNRKTLIAGGLILATAATAGRAAQEGPQPAKYAQVSWYEITNVDYKPARTERALQIVFDHFVPAARAAGIRTPRLLEYATGGEWDLTVIFPLAGGPGDLEWKTSPQDAKWLAALTESVGGAEALTELMDEYLAAIHRLERHVVRERDIGANRSVQAGP